MICYNCGNILTNSDYCSHCGMDVSVYKKIVKLSNLLCAFPVSVTGYGDADKAQVSSGGFKLTKLDDNMQVKNCPGLYIIGEAVNVNGICGGYNLQWTWTSAALAAEGISQNV